MKLTDRRVKTTQIKPKRYKLSDGYGLYILVEPNGAKKWRYKYSYMGKEKLLGLGKYPTVGLAEAREIRQDYRKLLDQNIDPSTKKKEEKRLAEFNNQNTFKTVGEEWHKNNLAKWTPKHAHKLWRRLELHIMPTLGNRPIADINALELLHAIRKLEKDDKTETTHKILQTCRAILQYAVLTQRIKYNPATDLKGVLKPHITENYPTIGHNMLPDFLAKLEEVKTTEMNRLAVKILIHTFVRQGELRRAKWVDIDFKAKEWRVPPETTKMRQLHIVPLSPQVIALLRQLNSISGQSLYLFPSQNRQKHPIMSENTINKLIHIMGYKGLLVGHGFRSMASTILNENGFKADVIERQLAHMPRDKVRAAYNRAEYLPERRQMMQWWGDYLETKTENRNG